MLEATSDRAGLQAMLDFEAGLAAAEARAGLVPEEAARAIAAGCRVDQADEPGHPETHALVEAVSHRALEAARPLRDELRDDAEVSAHLSPAEIERVLDPSRYLGSADAFVARTLKRYRAREDAGETA